MTHRLRLLTALIALALLPACASAPAAPSPPTSPAAAVAATAAPSAVPTVSASPTAAQAVPTPAPARLPDLTGAYPVGTEVRHLIDRARPDPYVPSIPYRELLAQLWYPAQPPPGATPGVYLPDLDLIDPKPPVVRDALARLRAHAVPDAPVAGAPARFPVLTLSHGASGTRAMYTALAEELASHGYVVVGIDHPYTTVGTRLPDGRVLRFEEMGDANTGSPVVVHPDGRTEQFEPVRMFTDDRVRLRAQDVRFVLDELERLNTDDPRGRFTGRLDLTRVGVLGHSFGGTTAAQACWLDRRCRAGASLDGDLAGDVTGAGLDQPFLFMHRAQAGLYGDTGLFFALQLRGGGYTLTIAGTDHISFSDLPLWPRTRPQAPIDPVRGHRIVTAYLQAFFGRHLKNEPAPLLDGPSAAYPEVQIEARHP